MFKSRAKLSSAVLRRPCRLTHTTLLAVVLACAACRTNPAQPSDASTVAPCGDQQKGADSEPSAETRRAPEGYVRGSPEWTLAKYLAAWRRQDWEGMVRHTQKSWRSNQRDPSQTLSDWYEFKQLIEVSIGSPQRSSAVMVDVPATVRYSFGGGKTFQKRILARIIRESGPYQPSPTGEWGVNPLSALSEK